MHNCGRKSEIRYKRDWEAYFKGTEPTPWPKTVDPKHIESGAPKGHGLAES